MKLAIQTLGCKNNQLESSTIADEFKRNGWDLVNFEEFADLYIVNTCTVTAKSDSHSRAAVRKAHKINPDAKIIVTGCYAQIDPAEIANIEGVWLVAGNAEKLNLFEIMSKLANNNANENGTRIEVKNIFDQKEFENKKVYSASGRTRINVKVQDGCNYRCSYCIVPFARGKSRSNKIVSVLEQVSEVSANFPEVVLTAIHLGQYGLDLEPKLSLSELLLQLEQLNELKRLRLSSIDPLEITDQLIDILANSKKICRHLHISLQSGSDTILKAMKRRYTVDVYREIINKLTNKIPGLAIGSDIIVGFPGETDELFQETYDNLDSLPLSYLHVFTYSRRRGTVAADLPDQIDETVKKDRNKLLKELSRRKNLQFRKSFIGQNLEIIPENSRDRVTGNLKGLSDNYISVQLNAGDSHKCTITPVKIIAADSNRTFGELI